MAKRLAIEWDARELRVVAGVVRGNRVTITNVASTPIESTDPKALGETLKRLLSESGLEKSVAGIALGRGKAELRELKLPPVPDAELPDVVRFQAIRSFAAAGEKSAIDFIPTRRESDGIRVLAAAVTPDEIKRCALVAVPSQTAVERLVLRPLAAAALFQHNDQATDRETVLIDLLAEDADIVVLRDGLPVFVRSIKLPEEVAVRVRTLSGEIRRSIMACQDVGSEPVGQRRVVMWGRAAVHKAEVDGLSEALGTTVETLDPFSLVEVDAKLRENMPEHTGRLAPLIGLLDCDARNSTGLIDFLNPRRPPDPPSPTGRYLVIGAAAAALVGTIFFFGWKRTSTLDADIAAQQLALNNLESAVKDADAAIARTEKVETFLDGNVFWLDELRRAAEKMPSSDKAIVDSITAEPRTGGGGQLTFSGGVTSSSIVGELEESLRDENRIVIGKGTGLVANKAPYNWTFTETVIIPPELVRETRDLPATPPEGEPESVSESDAASGTEAASEPEVEVVPEASDDVEPPPATDQASPAQPPSDAAGASVPKTAAPADTDASPSDVTAPAASGPVADPSTASPSASGESTTAPGSAAATTEPGDAAPIESDPPAADGDAPAVDSPVESEGQINANDIVDQTESTAQPETPVSAAAAENRE
jgi:Tfp pilus assembly PilM family ATPase